jgi:hypothetical protein
MLIAAVLVVLLQASLWWLLHELGASPGATLIGLVAVGFSITVLSTAVWADASLHIFPALIATDVVVAAHVRGLRTGRRRWHAVSVVLFAVGSLTQERALFALPLAVLVDWFLLGAGEPVRDRFRRLRAAWIPLAALMLVAAAVAVFIYVGYAGGAKPRPELGTVVRTGLGALTQGIVPPWVGVQFADLAPLAVQLAILVVLLLIAALLIGIRRRNADPLAFLAASFLLYYGFLVFSPILTEDVIAGTALRLHNGAYLLVPTVLAVSALTLRRRGTTAGAERPRDRRFWPAVVTAAVVTAGLVFAGGPFTRTHWFAERDAHGYLAAVERGAPEWSDPDVTLVPLRVPETVALAWAEVYGRHEFFLRFHRPGWVGQPLGPRPVVLDDHGEIRPVRLVTESRLDPLDPVACGAEESLLAAARPVSGEPLFLRLSYRTDAPATVRATATPGGAGGSPATLNWAVPLEAGQHTVVVPLHAERVDGVLLDWTGQGAGTCTVAASIVRPVYDNGNSCTGMDVFGAPTGRTSCTARGAS